MKKVRSHLWTLKNTEQTFFQEIQNSNAKSLDVPITLFSNINSDIQDVIEKIQEKNGILQDKYQLIDGTVILCASLSSSKIMTIAEDPRVYRIEKTVLYRTSEVL